MPSHTQVYIKIVFWFLDNWSPNDAIQVRITDESNTILNDKALTLNYSDTSWSGKLCGDNDLFDLRPVYLFVAADHQSDTLVLEIINTRFLSFDKIYFGIREVTILLSFTPITILPICGYSVPPNLLHGGNCDCELGKYLGAGCQPCDSSCGACYGSTSSTCRFCKVDHVYDGNNCIPCHPTCQTCFGPGIDQCLTCFSGGYIYENSTCIGHCNPPFLTRTVFGVNYCDFPCGLNEYRFDNGSCLANCSVPFGKLVYGTERYCDALCGTSGYIYEDQKCFSTCNSPMKVVSVPLANMCVPPCNDTLFFATDTRTCDETCRPPYSPTIHPYYVSCSIDYFYYQPFTKLPDTYAPIATLCVLGSTIAFLGSSWGITTTILVRMNQYVRFLDIHYAYEENSINAYWALKYMTLNFGFEVPDNIIESIDFVRLLPFLSFFGVTSSFLVNLWPQLVALFIGIAAFIPFAFIKWLGDKIILNKNVLKVLAHLKSLTTNYILIILYSSFGNCIFYGIIQFKNAEFGTFVSAISFLLPIFLIIGIMGLLAWQSNVLIKYYKRQAVLKKLEEKAPLEPDLYKTYPSFQVLFRDFKGHSLFPKGYLIFLLGRDVLFNICIALLFQFPVYQNVLITGLNCVFLTYLIVQRPFKNWYEGVENFLFEAMVLATFFIATIVSLVDDIEDEYIDLRNFFARIIVYINLVFLFSVIIFTGINLLFYIFNIYRDWKASKKPVIEAKPSLNLEFFNSTSNYFFNTDISKIEQEMTQDDTNKYIERLRNESNKIRHPFSWDSDDDDTNTKTEENTNQTKDQELSIKLRKRPTSLRRKKGKETANVAEIRERLEFGAQRKLQESQSSSILTRLPILGSELKTMNSSNQNKQNGLDILAAPKNDADLKCKEREAILAKTQTSMTRKGKIEDDSVDEPEEIFSKWARQRGKSSGNS